MGFEQNHPSPAHSPGTTSQLLSVHNIDVNNNNNNSKKSWNSLMRRTNSPSIAGKCSPNLDFGFRIW